VSNPINHLLIVLSQTDQRIQFVSSRKLQLEKQLAQLTAQLADERRKLASQEAAFKDCKQRQMLEEHRLKEEQDRIVERRKQLAAMGAKAAKLMEREIDIASRAVEALETKALHAMTDTDKIETKLAPLREMVEKLEAEFERVSSEAQPDIELVVEEVGRLTGERNVFLAQLEDRAKNLYLRISSRFPGSAIAEAVSGSCKSCFRALPHQTFNQVLSGINLIQCPGCNRILVCPETQESQKESAG
jgi:predicted  nucleic acid-binding Zn-ribbon protein